ncbi:MAG TPA: hypothetical protein VL172_02235, partial [Kofleriaceae bacterium]|nr:hypothetical protein [Kofleriaceae bacterium]
LPGISPRPSRANFILFAVAGPPSAAIEVHTRLDAAGIRIRNVGGLPALAGHLRVTIGTAAENDLFLRELAAARS